MSVQRGNGGWLSASAAAAVSSVRRAESESETRYERIRRIEVSLSAHRPAHPETDDGTVAVRENQLLSIIVEQDTQPRGATPPYEVLLIELDANAHAEGHEHVTVVDTSDACGCHARWTSVQVIAAIRDGAQFIVGADGDNRRAQLTPALCPVCPFATLVVAPQGRRSIPSRRR